MFDGLDTLFEFFETIVDFVVGFISHIMFVTEQINRGYIVSGMAVLHMPDIIKGFASALFGYAIIINLIHLGD